MPTQHHQIGDIMKEHDVEKYLTGLSNSIDNAVITHFTSIIYYVIL